MGLPHGNLGLDSAVWLIRSPRHSIVGDGLGIPVLPRPSLVSDHRVFARGLVNHVRDPGVPAGLDLRCVKVVYLVVHPSRPQWQLLVVLEVPVAKAVGAD